MTRTMITPHTISPIASSGSRVSRNIPTSRPAIASVSGMRIQASRQKRLDVICESPRLIGTNEVFRKAELEWSQTEN